MHGNLAGHQRARIPIYEVGKENISVRWRQVELEKKVSARQYAAG